MVNLKQKTREQLKEKCDCGGTGRFHLWSCGKPEVKRKIKEELKKYYLNKLIKNIIKEIKEIKELCQT